jgi:FkbM family methyltransferase
MVAPEGDHIGDMIRRSGAPYEYDLLRALRRVAPCGSTVIDVGANIGNHTLYFAVACGCIVHAFEPNPSALRCLEANVALNRLEEQVILHPEALSNRTGHAALRQLLPEEADLGTIAVVPDANGTASMVRLDDVSISGHVSVLKVDVEGGEPEVLEGARRVLRTHKPVIAVEAQTPADRRRLDTQLVKHGYSRFPITFAWTPTYLYVPYWWAAVRLLTEPLVISRAFSGARARLRRWPG